MDLHYRDRNVGRPSVGSWKIAVTSVFLLLAVGCSSRPHVTATDSDNGGHVQVDNGQVLDIVLPDDYKTSNAQWRDEQAYDSSVLKYLGSRYEPDRTAPGHTDAGIHTSRYEGSKSGIVHVTLVQEDNANPPNVVRCFAVVITVID
ncbi:MAG: inhibitor of cysteine peptidase [Mycobacterium sp.]|nr:inhibitor of cysteine peptidase [Mycobacterium sp.]